MPPCHIGDPAALSHARPGLGGLAPLPAQAQGTFLDGKRLAGHKPALVTSGSTITFGTLAQKYIVECETTGATAQDISELYFILRACLPWPNSGNHLQNMLLLSLGCCMWLY